MPGTPGVSSAPDVTWVSVRENHIARLTGSLIARRVFARRSKPRALRVAGQLIVSIGFVYSFYRNFPENIIETSFYLARHDVNFSVGEANKLSCHLLVDPIKSSTLS